MDINFSNASTVFFKSNVFFTGESSYGPIISTIKSIGLCIIQQFNQENCNKRKARMYDTYSTDQDLI